MICSSPTPKPRRYWFDDLRNVGSDGTLDRSYGEQGRWELSEIALSLSQYGTNWRIVTGDDEYFVVFSYSRDLIMGRFNAFGELDAAFGTAGWLRISHGQWFDELQNVTARGDVGFLIVGGGVSKDNYVGALLDRSGMLDESFADHGLLRIAKRTYVAGDGVKVCHEVNGKTTVLVGNATEGNTFAVSLQRFLADGSLDREFSGDGKVTTPLTSGYGYAEARQLVRLDDGGYLIAGPTPIVVGKGPFRTLIAKYTADGRLDVAFGGGGQVTLQVGYRQDISVAIEVDPSGRFLVATRSGNDSDDFAVTRLNANGTLDHTFGENGSWQLDLHSFSDVPTVMKLAENGDVLVGGYTTTGEETRLALVRLEGDRSGPPPWQNPELVTDANDDGRTTSLDALCVINSINRNLARELPPYRNVGLFADYVDVDEDGLLTPGDVLKVVALVIDPSAFADSWRSPQNNPTAVSILSSSDSPKWRCPNLADENNLLGCCK